MENVQSAAAPATIACQGQFTAEDYLQALKLNGRSRRPILYTLFGISAFFAAIALTASAPLTLTRILEIFMPAIIMVPLYLLYRFVLLPRQVHRLFNQQKSLHGTFTKQISPEQIVSTSSRGIVTIPLTDYHQYKASESLVLLYQSRIVFEMYPRRFFTSQADFDTFKSYLRQTLGKANP